MLLTEIRETDEGDVAIQLWKRTVQLPSQEDSDGAVGGWTERRDRKPLTSEWKVKNAPLLLGAWESWRFAC
jgi:hypothetical protein